MDPARLDDMGKLLLRIVVGGLMLFHGLDKVLHGPGVVREDLVTHGLPGALACGAYIGEIVAPVFILAGAWTRLWALVYRRKHGLRLRPRSWRGFPAPRPHLRLGGGALGLLHRHSRRGGAARSGPPCLRRATFPWD